MDLNEKQREAINSIEGPLLILAGAGSGKTTVIQKRVEKMMKKGIQPERVLAVTFTNKAADEMKERIAAAVGLEKARHIWIMTFHAMCTKILREDIIHTGVYQPNFSILDAGDALHVLKKVIIQQGYDPKKVTPGGMQYYISLLKNEMVDVESFRWMMPQHVYMDWEKASHVIETKIPPEKRGTVLAIYEAYQRQLVVQNALDFDDLILTTIQLCIQQQEVLEKYQERFHYIMVDEYQDTNHAQYVLIKLFAEKHRNLGVVGDDYQSIYAFRGSDIRNILEFEKDYPEATLIKLEQNYRCTPMILQAANEVIEKNTNQRVKTLYSHQADGERIGYYQAMNERDEARYVVNEIKKRIQAGEDYQNFAVLFRVNHQSKAFEEAFMRAGIPYQVVGSQTFYEKQEVKDALSYLRFLQNTNDVSSFLRIFPNGKKIAEELVANWKSSDFLDYLRKQTKYRSLTKPFVELIETYKQSSEKSLPILLSTLLVESGFLKRIKENMDDKTQERMENIGELLNIAMEMGNHRPDATIEEFLEFTVLHTDAVHQNDQKAVKIMTLHSAKGLEFPVVFLVGMEEGVFPYKRATTEEELEEERRLCYVGITRAKRKLYLTHARTRTMYNRQEEFEPSRFIYEFKEELIDPAYPLMKYQKEA